MYFMQSGMFSFQWSMKVMTSNFTFATHFGPFEIRIDWDGYFTVKILRI